jgi:uncharacterized repeat protein (TIGR04052 family)
MLAAVASAAALAAATQTIEIRFAAVVAAQPFRCGATYAGVGSPAVTVRPTDFRFYVTGLALLDRRGRRVPVELDQDGLWQYRDIALLDFEDGSGPCRGGNAGLNLVLHGRVPKGRHAGLEFQVGLPPDLNHGDAAAAPVPLNYTSMFWAWRAGYRFFKIDMDVIRAGAAPADRATGFPIHIGSTGCGAGALTAPPSLPCRNPNLVAVRFERFDPARDVVQVDLAAIVADTDPTVNAPDTAPGCMSAPEDSDCRGVFAAFGLSWREQGPGLQRVFRRN